MKLDAREEHIQILKRDREAWRDPQAREKGGGRRGGGGWSSSSRREGGGEAADASSEEAALLHLAQGVRGTVRSAHSPDGDAVPASSRGGQRRAGGEAGGGGGQG